MGWTPKSRDGAKKKKTSVKDLSFHRHPSTKLQEMTHTYLQQTQPVLHTRLATLQAEEDRPKDHCTAEAADGLNARENAYSKVSDVMPQEWSEKAPV